jgi:hypothetical protein
MATLRPFRDYSEHDVINLFAFDFDVEGAATRGALVKIKDGWTAHSADVDAFGSSPDMNSWSLNNVVNMRYGLSALVDLADSGDTPLGMILYDVAEVDENGEKLIYNPRKAAEMQTAVSGQAVPVLTKGLVMVNGVDGTPAAGGLAYSADDGQISATAGGTKKQIGMFMGLTGIGGDVLLRLDINHGGGANAANA